MGFCLLFLMEDDFFTNSKALIFSQWKGQKERPVFLLSDEVAVAYKQENTLLSSSFYGYFYKYACTGKRSKVDSKFPKIYEENSV